jgi:Xaa-Pro aminopeptidase
MTAETWDEAWSNPVLSLAERDLRHERVRALMRQDGIDVICCLPWTSRHDASQGDSRYLTQLGENSDETSVAFSLDDLTAWHSRGGVWPSSSWVSDLRAAPRGTGGHTIVDWIAEKDLQRGKIAIAGLTGGMLSRCGALEGEVNWQSVRRIREAFPEADIVSATDLLGEARFQKSEEEIEFLRKSRQIASAVIGAVAAHARSGVTEREVWGRMLRTYAVVGGSFEPNFGWITGPAGDTSQRLQQPTFRRLQEGDLLITEVQGRWGGYGTRIDRLFGIGRLPADVRAASRTCLTAFHRTVEAMRPGVTVADVLQAGQGDVLGRRGNVVVSLTGCGTGDDGPVAGTGSSEEVLAVRLRENCVVTVSCDAVVDGRPNYGRWAETVVVRAKGAELLADLDQPFHELS